jgi:hypothetical protein
MAESGDPERSAEPPADERAGGPTAESSDPERSVEATADEREGGAIFESSDAEGPIEPGSPTVEGTLFVLLGALLAGGAVLHLWLLFN